MMQNSVDSQPITIVVVDDHQLIRAGTISIIQEQYPSVRIIPAITAEQALEEISIAKPTAVIVDLSIPQNKGQTAQIETGIDLVHSLMDQYPMLNIMVQSSYVKALVRIKPYIDNHQGGFTIADKSSSTEEMLKMFNWCTEGITHTKILKTDLEIKPEWLDVLNLAFKEGLQDKAIAQRMYKSLRMVRHYWSKIQDALQVYPDDEQNIRALTLIRAREIGLID